MTDAAKKYNSAEVEFHAVDDATIALRKFGSGPALLFIHGYPVNGYTWRYLIPELSKNYTCLVVDLPGLGSSKWNSKTDFTFTAQARRLIFQIEKLGVKKFSIIAQNTGATIARMIALQKPHEVKSLVLFNTEIPGHRPPFIPFYQKIAKLPGAAVVSNLGLGSKAFLRSRFGFGQFYFDKKLFDDPEFLAPYVDRLKDNFKNINGALKYQDGIEWNVIDSLRHEHKNIYARTLLLWGENDETFPVKLAEKMVLQFSGNATLKRLQNASLMPQEEVPEMCLAYIQPFLEKS